MRRFWLGVALFAVGCGGDDSQSETTVDPGSVAPTFPVYWPERTRQVESIAGALSVKIELRRGLDGPLMLNQTFERPTAIGATVSQYESAQFVPPGTYELKALHYSRRQADGSTIATSTAQVRVMPDGTIADLNSQPIFPISPVEEFVSINIAAASGPRVGRSTFLYAILGFSNGSHANLTQGSLRCEQVAGAELARVDSDCSVHGIAPGGTVGVKVFFGARELLYSFIVGQ